MQHLLVVDTRGSFRNGTRSSHLQPAYNGIKNVLESVYKEGGARALYRGVGPTLIGILPYAGLKFYIYEELKMHVPEEHQKSIVMRLSCGALAGLFGQTFTYPLDVVRRQMQVEHSVQGGARYKSTLEGLSTIVRNQGWTQLFAGLSINYIKGYVFVDRDGKHFRHVLNWLRDGVVPTLKDAEYSELLREAEYYQLLVSHSVFNMEIIHYALVV
ncbi:hypothetical protein TEA_020746 [Camellia sinensis var. sinensis]|uniref:Uncharacterized protein n=1 Tax=Camellia sinensis var. sinensis TaxID=542762 RepID=A0A4S4DIL5_CAMSN|nr:hypothetical protein TEA_020746 [Camellia sinensis var. sinensis]